MLLKDYRFELVLPECNPSALTVNAVAELDEDIGEVLPYLNASLRGCRFYPEGNFLRILQGGRVITLYPRKITVTGLRDREEAARVLSEVKELINQTYANRRSITPSYKKGDEVKPLQVYNLLPRTNCKKCGEPSCFAFAARLVKQEAELAACAPLAEPAWQENRQKLAALLMLT
ncbi:MAG: (Fe-S)-binding protein [Desulfotomaculales bacterium]